MSIWNINAAGPRKHCPGQLTRGQVGFCSKVRKGDERHITLHGDVNVRGRVAWIIDDLVRTGGTLKACAEKLREEGAAAVIAFCVHAAGSVQEIEALSKTGLIEQIYLSNSVEHTARQLEAENRGIIIVDLLHLIACDVWRSDRFYSVVEENGTAPTDGAEATNKGQ
jgi:phosphoribosylpyrophosphate synthetase